MPIATPEVYAEMLGRAKEHSFAFPAINCVGSESVNAAIKGFADAGSDGIIQFSTGGAEFASGLGIKEMVTGAVALAEFAHIVAAKYPISVALHTDHCPKDKLDTYVRPLLAISGERVAKGQNPLFQSHMWDGSAVPIDDNLEIAKELLKIAAEAKIVLEIEIGVVGGEEDGVEAEINDKLYTTPEDFEKTIDALGVGEHGKYLLAATFGNVHGVYKPGNVKLRPEVLEQGQKVAVAKLGLPDGSKPFDFVFHGGSGSLKSEIEDSLNFGVVKMNVDTDTQYAFTRPIAAHMFSNYDGVLKVDGEVGNKKVYDPRSYLKKAEAGMTERVIEACRDLHSTGRSVTARLAAGCLADLPLVVAELQIQAARRTSLRGVRHERRDIGLRMVAVDHHLVDGGHYGIPLGRRYPCMGCDPHAVVILDVVVPGGAAGDAAQLGQVTLFERGAVAVDGRADPVLLRHDRLRVAGQQQRTQHRDGHQRRDHQHQRDHPTPAAAFRRRLGCFTARRNDLWSNGFRNRRGRGGHDLGRRFRRSVDPRRRPRIEAGRSREPAFGLLGQPRPQRWRPKPP